MRISMNTISKRAMGCVIQRQAAICGDCDVGLEPLHQLAEYELIGCVVFGQ